MMEKNILPIEDEGKYQKRLESKFLKKKRAMENFILPPRLKKAEVC